MKVTLTAKRELFNYLVFGVLTTLVNILSYALLTRVLAFDFKAATTIAWILAVLFAFFTNKVYVFGSRDKDLITVSKELGSFLLFRLLSYILDIFSMVFLVQFLLADDLIAKILANILVIVFNYLASKLFVFKQLVGSDSK